MGCLGRRYQRNVGHGTPAICCIRSSQVICHLFPKRSFLFCLLLTLPSSPADICCYVEWNLGFFSEWLGLSQKSCGAWSKTHFSAWRDTFPGQARLLLKYTKEPRLKDFKTFFKMLYSPRCFYRNKDLGNELISVKPWTFRVNLIRDGKPVPLGPRLISLLLGSLCILLFDMMMLSDGYLFYLSNCKYQKCLVLKGRVELSQMPHLNFKNGGKFGEFPYKALKGSPWFSFSGCWAAFFMDFHRHRDQFFQQHTKHWFVKKSPPC